MSEFDSLSDSDWLDIASRTSDDNDSVSSHDGLSSRPLSRRSSISLGSSHESEVEAWEGFVDESGDESALEPGMCIVRPLTTGASESLPTGTIPDISHDLSDDQRVKEALDQSMVGTLSASRTSTASHSSHSSIRDLRLSFPDPLTSSRDQLNRSYQEVPDSETLSAANEADTTISLSDSVLSSSEHEPEPVAIASQGHHHEVTQQDNNNTDIGLDVVLYGSSSPIKWSFVQDLIQKAAHFSGNVVLSTLDPNAGPVQTLELRGGKDNSILTAITVHDCTNDNPSLTDTDDVMCPSLAIIYLPATTLPVLSLHTAYLPVVVPVSSSSADGEAGHVLRHAAEDDWELLAVPANRTIILNSDKTPVVSADVLSRLEPWKAFEVIQNVLDGPARQIRAASDNGHPTRAVTLFALVSIMMGVAFNTAFHSPVSITSPGSTRLGPSSTWGILPAHQFNRTLAVPVAGTSSALATSSSRDFSLSVVTPGITSLSVNPPQVNSLSVTSRVNSLSVNSHPSSLSTVYTPTSLAVPGPSRLPVVASDATQASSSKDMMVRAVTPASLSEVQPEASVLSATRTEKKRARLDVTTPNSLSLRFSNGISEAMDIGAKIFANAARMESGVKDFVDAMDDFMNTVQTQTQTVVSQSKGKARAFGEEVISRNDRARDRAKELRKKGEEFLSSASVQFLERTEIAKQRAKGFKDSFKQTETWKSYEKVHADLALKLKAPESYTKDKPGWKSRKDAEGCWASHRPGFLHRLPLPVH